MKSTQPLPTPDSNSHTAAHGTHPLSLRWRRARPALLLFVGGATTAWLASALMNRAISTQTPPRSLPVAKVKSTPAPERLSLAEWRRRNPADASFLDRAGVAASAASTSSAPTIEASVMPVLPAASASSMSDAAMEVADSNQDGTAWKGFVARGEDDRRRLTERREEDRLLQERRVLEAQKKRIERELEVKALQEKYRAEDKQAADLARDEDKRRVQSRVDEDRKASDERERSGRQLAEAPSTSPSPGAQP